MAAEKFRFEPVPRSVRLAWLSSLMKAMGAAGLVRSTPRFNVRAAAAVTDRLPVPPTLTRLATPAREETPPGVCETRDATSTLNGSVVETDLLSVRATLMRWVALS